MNKRPKLNSYALTGIFRPVRSTVSNRFQLFYTQKHIPSAHFYFVVIFVCLFVNEEVRFRKNEGAKCFLNKNKTKRIVTVHPSVDVLLLFFNKSTMSTTMPDLPFTSLCPLLLSCPLLLKVLHKTIVSLSVQASKRASRENVHCCVFLAKPINSPLPEHPSHLGDCVYGCMFMNT